MVNKNIPFPVITLIEWYKNNSRNFPWRQHKTPYGILVSEFMLQQTTTQTILKAFPKFMNRFPTLKSLAHATEDDVLDSWAGLGYYKRAKNLKQSADIIYKHGWSYTLQDMKKLPGIGDYTAGALLSLAWNIKVPAIDTNVTRLSIRYHNAILSTSYIKTFIQNLLEQVPKEQTGLLNEAFIELGSTHCKHKNPLCISCPIKKTCLGHIHVGYLNNTNKPIHRTSFDGTPHDHIQNHWQHLLPKKLSPKPTKQGTIYVIKTPTNQYFVQRRDSNGLLPGLLSFPLQIEHTKYDTPLPIHVDHNNTMIYTPNPLIVQNTHMWNNAIRHSFTHFHLVAHIMEVVIQDHLLDTQEGQFLSSEILMTKLPTLMKKALQFIKDAHHHGGVDS